MDILLFIKYYLLYYIKYIIRITWIAEIISSSSFYPFIWFRLFKKEMSSFNIL